MKISTKGRYALRLMLDLAQHGMEQEYVSIKKVSLRQDISEKYLEQIVNYFSIVYYKKIPGWYSRPGILYIYSVFILLYSVQHCSVPAVFPVNPAE